MLGREFASTKLRLQLSRFYHVFLVAPGISKCDMRGAIYKLLKGLAEASGSRTHRRQGDLPPAGFEDRDDHRTACASAPTLRPYLTGDMAARLAMLGATLGHAGARPATETKCEEFPRRGCGGRKLARWLSQDAEARGDDLSRF